MAEQFKLYAVRHNCLEARAFLDTLDTRPYGAAAFNGLPGEYGRLPRMLTFMPDAANDRGPGEHQMSPEEKAAFEARVLDLGDRLERIKAQRDTDAQASADAEMRGRGMAYGMRMAAELVGAVIVGGAIGVGLDKWLGTWPWLFFLLFLVGFAAGVLNVVRAYERIQREIAVRTGGRIGHRVAEDDDD